jgi:hypothetical protein
VEIPIVVFSIHVEALEKPITPKLIPLVLPKIGVGVEVTLIDSIAHASKVSKTPNIVLKDTHVMERPESQLIPLVEPVNTINE